MPNTLLKFQCRCCDHIPRSAYVNLRPHREAPFERIRVRKIRKPSLDVLLGPTDCCLRLLPNYNETSCARAVCTVARDFQDGRMAIEFPRDERGCSGYLVRYRNVDVIWFSLLTHRYQYYGLIPHYDEHNPVLAHRLNSQGRRSELLPLIT